MNEWLWISENLIDELRIKRWIRKWSLQSEHYLKNKASKKKIQASTGFEPMAFAILVQCSTTSLSAVHIYDFQSFIHHFTRLFKINIMTSSQLAWEFSSATWVLEPITSWLNWPILLHHPDNSSQRTLMMTSTQVVKRLFSTANNNFLKFPLSIWLSKRLWWKWL